MQACRLHGQRYQYAYQEPMPVEQLVRAVCDTKQGYTQFGGQRPFGVSILYAGWCVVLFLLFFGFLVLLSVRQIVVCSPQHNNTTLTKHKIRNKTTNTRDEHYGYQLYQSDPSGNYGGWKAVAIGGGHAAAQNLLKTEYPADGAAGLALADAVPLIVKVLAKSMDSSLSADKVELATLRRDEASSEVQFKVYEAGELQPLLDKANADKEAAAAT